MVWEPDVQALLGDEVRALDGALSVAGLRRLPVSLGVCDGLFSVEERRVVLSRRLLEGRVGGSGAGSKFVPPVPSPRQAAGGIVAGLLMHALFEHMGRPLTFDWVSVGWALYRCDRMFPGWGLAEGWVADAYVSGDIGSDPSRGVLAMQAWRQLGVDVDKRVIEVLRDGMYPSVTEWLAIVERIVDLHEGPLRSFGVLLPTMTVRHPPVSMSMWSWAYVGLATQHYGGRLVATEGLAASRPWLLAGAGGRSLVAAAGRSGSVRLESGGPAATWDLVGVETTEEVVGARGVHLRMGEDNTFVLEVAQGVVGPCAALAQATAKAIQVEGIWHVAGVRTVRLVPDGIAETKGLAEVRRVHPVLQALLTQPWEWLVRGERLFARLKCPSGDPTELRWRRLPSPSL